MASCIGLYVYVIYIGHILCITCILRHNIAKLRRFCLYMFCMHEVVHATACNVVHTSNAKDCLFCSLMWQALNTRALFQYWTFLLIASHTMYSHLFVAVLKYSIRYSIACKHCVVISYSLAEPGPLILVGIEGHIADQWPGGPGLAQ